jgi:O-antigen/teichoic acid export membrane protein
VLIAANQQQVLTRAFVFGVLFNIVGNLLLIPRLGYIGAATATILSEFSLLFPFYWIVRRSVGTVPWGRVFGPPLLAVAAMGCTIWLLQRAEFSLLLALPAGLLVYVAVLPVAGAFRGEEMALVMRALPIGPLRRLPLKPPA